MVAWRSAHVGWSCLITLRFAGTPRPEDRLRRVLRDNGLSITMFTLFLVFLVAQSVAGYKTTGSGNQQHRQPKES
jgi:Domain of unknown function (DUF6766)